jgi:cell division protein FtsN
MRQQPTQLNEVPWNEQTPAQRQQTLQRQQQQSQLQQQSRMPQQQQQQQAPRQAPVAPVTRATPAVREPVKQQAAPAQAPAQTAQQPKTESKPKEAEKSQHWMVQCGSFKRTDQAESIRAQLAFEGFESRITTGGGWNRVVIGPYNSRSSADSTLKRLRGSGHSNCIPLASGG